MCFMFIFKVGPSCRPSEIIAEQNNECLRQTGLIEVLKVCQVEPPWVILRGTRLNYFLIAEGILFSAWAAAQCPQLMVRCTLNIMRVTSVRAVK